MKKILFASFAAIALAVVVGPARGQTQGEKRSVTIAEVKMSTDLSVAKVFLSMMLAKNKNVVLAGINSHKSEIRKALGDRIRNQARIVPELIFFIDEVEENAQRMEDLLKSLNIPKEEK